jgi:hypothetical protein
MRDRTLLIATIALLAGACSTTTPIGIEETGAAGTGMSGPPAVPPMPGAYVPSGVAVLNDQAFTNPSGISGDWVGYFENYNFTGSDAVRFHFGVDADGHDTISVTLGDGVVPPPPTDAAQAWPVPMIIGGGPGPGIIYPQRRLDGFTYTAHEVTWQGRRLRFQLIGGEPWTVWCGLQTSYGLPNSPYDPTIVLYTCDEGRPIDCNAGVCMYRDGSGLADLNHAMMCAATTGICDCNDTGCGPGTNTRFMFDLTFYDGHAYGSAMGFNVQLMPEAP